jgi:hypothetical protein
MQWDYNTSRYCESCHQTRVFKVKNFSVEGLTGSILFCGTCGECFVVSAKVDVHYKEKPK